MRILGEESPRFGILSLWYAVVGFGLALVSFMTFAAVPDNYDNAKLPYIVTAFVLAFFVFAPLLHILGIVNGVRQLTWSDQRHWLGISGVVLNAPG